MRRRGVRAAGAILAAAMTMGLLAGTPAKASGEIRIVRDRFGVPHVYAPTAADVSYGAGYALAQDRLWQMHVFRLVAKGRLSHLLGPVVVAGDKTVRFWTYTADERRRRFATYPPDIQDNVRAFAEGVTAYMREVRADPRKLPLEFAEFAEPVDDWTVDDSIAMSDYLIYTFGSGGGAEIRNLADRQALVAALGEAEGLKAFDDLIWVNDPDAPLSIPADYDWRSSPTRARAEADAKQLTADARISLPEDRKDAGPVVAASRVAAAAAPAMPPVSAKVLGDYDALEAGREQLQRYIKFGSNAEIVAPSRTDTGNTALQAGPQVGYFVPGALTDFGLHSEDGKLDATGMTFAGAGPAVLIGRGKGYNWTTTTGASDLTDTYVERLNPADRTLYEFEGRWERMECRVEPYEIHGIPFDSQEICRTRHGPVLSFDTANNVAYSLRYGWFNQEGGTVEGFFRYNESRSIEDFATYANLLASNHNMFYADDQGNIGYWHPGNFPRRPAGDLRLPYDGRGGQEWQGLLTAQEVPHAVNPPRGWLANWNNKPAIDWDRENGWGAVHGVQTFLNNLDAAKPALPDPFGGLVNPDRSVSWQDLNANIRYAAFRDFNADFFQSYLPASGRDAVEDAALEVLRTYNGFRYDANGDGYVDSAGYTILGRWVSELRSAVFADDLPSALYGRTNSSTLLHVLKGASAGLPPRRDWLNGRPVSDVIADAYTKTITALKGSYKNDDPRTWLSKQPRTKYTRLNADLLPDAARGIAAGQLASQGLELKALGSGGLPTPGNVPDHIAMNRGTYNHIVTYDAPPTGSGVLGAAPSTSGSVISPGQSGFIDLTGRDGPHARDQFDLYVQWRYKPMPMTLAEARSVAESEVVLVR